MCKTDKNEDVLKEKWYADVISVDLPTVTTNEKLYKNPTPHCDILIVAASVCALYPTNICDNEYLLPSHSIRISKK